MSEQTRFLWSVGKGSMLCLLLIASVFGSNYITLPKKFHSATYAHITSLVFLIVIFTMSVYLAERFRFYSIGIVAIALAIYAGSLFQFDDLIPDLCKSETSDECWDDFAAFFLAIYSGFALIYLSSLSYLYTLIRKKFDDWFQTAGKGDMFFYGGLLTVYYILLFSQVHFLARGSNVWYFLWSLVHLTLFQIGREIRFSAGWRGRVALIATAIFGVLFTFSFGFLCVSFSLDADVSKDESGVMKFVALTMLLVTVIGFFVKPFRYFRERKPWPAAW